MIAILLFWLAASVFGMVCVRYFLAPGDLTTRPLSEWSGFDLSQLVLIGAMIGGTITCVFGLYLFAVHNW